MASNPEDDPAGEAALDVRQQGDEPPFWEWMMAGLGALLLVSAVAYLLMEANGMASQPVLAQVELREVVQREAQHVVLVRVHNRGRMAAAQLRVSGTLQDQGREVERSETEFDYVPGRSWREASLLFGQDPRGRLVLKVESFQKP